MKMHNNNDHVTGLGALCGLITSAIFSQSFWLGLVETSIYAVVGAVLGGLATFYVTFLLKKLHKTDKQQNNG